MEENILIGVYKVWQEGKCHSEGTELGRGTNFKRAMKASDSKWIRRFTLHTSSLNLPLRNGTVEGANRGSSKLDKGKELDGGERSSEGRWCVSRPIFSVPPGQLHAITSLHLLNCSLGGWEGYRAVRLFLGTGDEDQNFSEGSWLVDRELRKKFSY